jgi:hypothetical protein
MFNSIIFKMRLDILPFEYSEILYFDIKSINLFIDLISVKSNKVFYI